MQSTGHTSTQAVSFVPTHGSAITYAIRGLSYEEQLVSILPKRSQNNSQNFLYQKTGGCTRLAQPSFCGLHRNAKRCHSEESATRNLSRCCRYVAQVFRPEALRFWCWSR